ncbi:TRPM8 channel-associated factor homolog [Austrofundulus limnaeus]|uniref:TRPM8 channel-associated factor homolog n=1 Tax=Austrofundulus limnaeus TaxID=52670 RepID=A0A2I4BRQ1_AUSLI|nr:PREDICTED: TRPM8 channel-associated factor homolog [Austrofundulus limnaeus]
MSDQQTQSYHAEAYKSLVKNLKEVDLRSSSVPCDLELTGEKAFPVLMNSEGHVLMAASLYGRGRIVVLGHEQYLTLCPALVENALIWLGGGKSENLSVGVHKKLKAVADNLSKSNFQVSLVEGFSENLGVNVFVSDAYEVGASAGDLVAFMKAGGGVLIGGQAWNWTAQNPNENLILQFPGNKVSGVAGIYFSAQYAKGENLPISPEIPNSWKSLHSTMTFKRDLEFLLKGISEFDIQGDAVPSEALIHGPLAFPICTTNDGQAFLAGTYYGRGRVILVTHESFIASEKMASFWNNSFHWLDQNRKGVIGFCPEIEILPNLGLQCETTTIRQDLSVYVCTVWNEEDPEKIQNFVAEGGGLLIGGHAWWWEYQHPGQNPLQDFSGNKILNKMGLSVLKETVSAGVYKAPDPSQINHSHFLHLLYRFAAHVYEGRELTKQDEELLIKLGTECADFLSMKAYDSFSYTQILSILTDILKLHMPQVNEQNPVRSAQDRMLLMLATEVFNVSLSKDTLLPFLIKKIPPVVNNMKIKINAQTAENEEWISTGLYLPPGMKTWMTIPPKLVNRKWMIQIGCQSDTLNEEELLRAPVVIKSFLVTSERMQVWNLWGGLIYLVAPPDVKVEEEEVEVEVAMSAPFYKTGVTKSDAWYYIREAPAPWAEFEFENIILTVPSHVIRELEFPLEVENLWNDIMKGVADLAAKPQKFIQKERIVADVQISAGWLHSGYPIMMHSSEAEMLFDLNKARTEGLWGELHELGHNQQRSCWEFPPHTTEATCNLWSVYVSEQVLGVSRAKAHEALTPESRRCSINQYVQGGRRLSDWTVWTALETYLQLQERFDWNPFKKVFAAYHKMSNFPTDNTGKMNLYAETFSQTVGMDLTGFFKAWGWPIEAATEEKLSGLPPWFDHPMVQYL